MDDSAVILGRLAALHPKKIDLSLNRIRVLLERLEHPERKMPPVIHIAGTNGKGSVLAYLEAILNASGQRVHAFSSPYIRSFHEYIRLATHGTATPIEEGYLTGLLNRIQRVNQETPGTFFEFATAAAFLAFSEQPADAILLEVGLGGRYDATNVIERPELTIITPIGIDHVEFLGSDIRGIAGEKAGIFKRGVPAIIAPQSPEVSEVLSRELVAVGATAIRGGLDWSVERTATGLRYCEGGGWENFPAPSLVGSFQTVNAGTAIAAARRLEHLGVNARSIGVGIASAYWPGRMMRIRSGPLLELLPRGAELWLDGAHNPHAAGALATSLSELDASEPRPLEIICGLMARKDAMGFMHELAAVTGHVRTVAIVGADDAYSPLELAAAARAAGLQASAWDDLGQALKSISTQRPRVMICGSFVLLGQALAANHQNPWPSELLAVE